MTDTFCSFTHTHTHTHTRVNILTDDTQYFCVCWCVFAQTVATCVCIRSEDTHKSKRILTEDTHHVISWTDDTHMFQTTGDFITKSFFSFVFPLMSQDGDSGMLHLGFSRDFTIKITTSVERLYPKSAVLRTGDVLGCRMSPFRWCVSCRCHRLVCVHMYTHTHTHTKFVTCFLLPK